MKNILSKWHLNFATYLFFLLSFCCGFFKQSLILFFLVFFHECGHILAILLCHYSFLRVDIYPFGGMTRIDKPLNSSINKEIFIACSGVFLQLILGLFLFLFRNSFSDYHLFQSYNFILIFFNLLPIIPLDGSVILHAFLEKFFSYQKAFFLYEFFSVLFFLCFLFANFYFNVDNYFICGVLFTQFLLLKKQEKYLFHRFYLERFLNNYPYKKIINHKTVDISFLKKETKHFFYLSNRYVTEQDVLAKYYLTEPKKSGKMDMF